MAEQRALNPQVQGSNPWGRTKKAQVRALIPGTDRQHDQKHPYRIPSPI
jgi:hypothetical protein